MTFFYLLTSDHVKEEYLPWAFFFMLLKKAFNGFRALESI